MDLTFAVAFPIVAAVVLTVGGLALGIVVRRWVVPRLVRSAQATRAGVDDVLVAALLGPLVLWFTMLVLSVIMRGREVTDQYLIRHEFMKRLHHRYLAEGIDLPRVGMALPPRRLEAPPAS